MVFIRFIGNSIKYRAPSAKYRTPNTEFRNKGGYRFRKYRTPNTEFRNKGALPLAFGRLFSHEERLISVFGVRYSVFDIHLKIFP